MNSPKLSTLQFNCAFWGKSSSLNCWTFLTVGWENLIIKVSVFGPIFSLHRDDDEDDDGDDGGIGDGDEDGVDDDDDEGDDDGNGDDDHLTSVCIY